MPAQTLPETSTLRMERTFDATPEMLWDAWTRPEHVAKWWNPAPGIDAEVHGIDLRVGGRLRLTMTVPAARESMGTDRFPVDGEFVRLDRPHEIVLRMREGGDEGFVAMLTVRFEPDGARTRMRFEVVGLPDDETRDMLEEGWGQCFANLADHLSRTAPSKEELTMTTPSPIRLERTFDCTPQEMWAAWTDPKLYAKWLNPTGLDLVIHEWDLRVGGRIRFDMPLPDGKVNHEEGVFHVLSPYTRFVSGNEDKSFLVDVEMQPRGARTHLVVNITGVPAEWREPAIQGWGVCFDNLERVLKEHRG